MPVLRLLGAKVGIKRDPLELPPDVAEKYGRSDSVIVVPDNAKAKSRKSTVLFVGRLARHDFYVGQRVLVPWTGGEKIPAMDDIQVPEFEVYHASDIPAEIED